MHVSRSEDVYFLDSNRGFAVTLNSEIFKTTDGGKNWVQKNDLLDTAAFRSIEFLDDGLTGIAAGLFYGKTFRTTDGGEHWNNITSAFTDTSFLFRHNICGMGHFGSSFYGVGWWGGNTAHFYKSTDKGLTWTTSYIDPSLASGLVDVVFLSADTGFASGGRNAVPNNYVFNFNPESVVLKTTDGGAHWTKVFSDTTIGGRIWKLQFLNHQLAFGSIEPYYGDTVAMIKSTDGGNHWSIVGTHFSQRTNSSSSTAGYTQGVGFVTPLHGWLGGYYSGIYETKDGGLTWDILQFGANVNRIFVLDATHVFAGGKQVYRYGYDLKTTGIATPDNTVLAPHTLYPVTPNPALGKINIEFDLKTTTNVLLQVAGIDAKNVWKIAAGRMQAGHYIYYWNDAAAPNGNYLVWLGTDEIPLSQKFVLRR